LFPANLKNIALVYQTCEKCQGKFQKNFRAPRNFATFSKIFQKSPRGQVRRRSFTGSGVYGKLKAMMTQKGSILVQLDPSRMPPDAVERLERMGDGREVLLTTDRERIEQNLGRVEIYIGEIDYAYLSRMPAVRWAQLWYAGVDGMQGYPELIERPFLFTNARIHGPQIAEHLFAMILSWNRRLPQVFEAKKRREWIRVPASFLGSASPLRTLAGASMLILGYGTIGEHVAGVARAFGMQVTGLRRNPAGSGAAGLRIEAAERLRELLPEADYVLNLHPHTPATNHLFGATEFSLMKKSALYMSVGRGATTDEAALIAALRSASIAGALLDVTEREPLPPDSPLWDLDNLILSPHYAGFRPGYDLIALELALDNLGRYVRGEPLKYLVDKRAGY
jgi:phosphoglycerate dehydrogenase-like enzyme